MIARRPMSGYELAREFEQTLAHAWTAQHSQIYPELNRMAGEGLIWVSEQGLRRRKTYSITEAGLDAVREWLAGPRPESSPRNEQTVRTFLLWLLDGETASALLETEAAHHRERLADYERRTGINASCDAEFSERLALEWGIRYERAYAEWAAWAEKQLASRREKAGWGADWERVRAAARHETRQPRTGSDAAVRR